MKRYCCLTLVIVFAVGPLIAVGGESENSIVAPSGVRETTQCCPGAAKVLLPFPFYLCGLFSFVEIAFTGCLLTCFMPSRRRRTWR